MKKRIISVLLALVMVFALLPAIAWAAEADGVAKIAASAEFVGSGGNGTEDKPYLISILDDLEAFRDYINADADGEYRYDRQVRLGRYNVDADRNVVNRV